MAALRALLLIVLLVIVAFLAYQWGTGSGMHRTAAASAPSTGTSGTIDVSQARERGAKIGEDAAKTAAAVRESVGEAAITSKIKAKMALDDNVPARRIEVST